MDYKVVIPQKDIEIVEFIQEGVKGIAEVNISLRSFKPKIVFGWHLSIMVHLQNTNNIGLPKKKDNILINTFLNFLESEFIGEDIKRPNVLFLSKINWNNTSELIWRAHDPEYINKKIQEIIKSKKYPFPFDYRIDPDKEWKLAEWHLKEHNVK